MLIKSLEAINFRKYNKLIVNDIPESGVITISGSNESGKTSIGEAICFALFGRTFSLDEKGLKKIVCWGADHTEVTLTLETGQGDIYVLRRSVNQNAEMQVSLVKREGALGAKDNASLTEDVDKVNQIIVRLLGFDFDAFSNSFYLAQRELISPDPHSQIIKQMAGISAYAKITDDLKADNQKNADKIADLTPQAENTKLALDELNVDETWLPELVFTENTLDKEHQDHQRFMGEINEGQQLYQQNFNLFHRAKKYSGLFGFLAGVLFAVSLILWGLWLVNFTYPENFQTFLLQNISDTQFHSYKKFTENWLLPSAIVSSLLALLSCLMSMRAKTKMKKLDAIAQEFSGILGAGHNCATTLVEATLPERVVQLLLQRRADDSLALQVLPTTEHFNNLLRVTDEVSGYQASSEEIVDVTDLLSQALQNKDHEIMSLNNTTREEVSREKERVDQAENLNTHLQGLRLSIDQCNECIDTQTIAMGLLQRGAKSLINKFNNNISKLSASILPSFTQDRYNRLIIADDFSVRIYSDEKQDFMDFDEISSGTQRQVMLVLRIAMSEQLAINTGNNKQFIFLDEPFAFFDQARTKATLKVLPNISNVIKQVWVCAQEFPVDSTVEKQIDCPSLESELIV